MLTNIDLIPDDDELYNWQLEIIPVLLLAFFETGSMMINPCAKTIIEALYSIHLEKING